MFKTTGNFVEICCKEHDNNEGCSAVHLSKEDFQKACKYMEPEYCFCPDEDCHVLVVSGNYNPATSSACEYGLANTADIKNH